MKKNYFVLTLFLSLFAVGALAQPTVVSTQDLSIDIITKSSYDVDNVQYNMSQVLTDLGIDSIDQATVIAYHEDGTYDEVAQAEPNVYWYNSSGWVDAWSGDGILYTQLDTVYSKDYIGVGQRPEKIGDYADQSVVIHEGLMANDKIVKINITVNISAPPPIEGTVVNTQEITMHVQPRSDYLQDSTVFDLDQTLTDLDIGALSEATIIGIDTEGAYTDGSTADNGGFWQTLDGEVDSYGSTAVWVSTNNYEDGWIGVGQMPDSLIIGDVFTVQYGFLANDKIELIVITGKIVNVGVDQKEADSHSIMSFANPVQDELRVAVSANEVENATLTVYSITGAKVFSKNNISTVENIDLGHIASGVYFLNFDNGIKRETMKFIKQ